VSKQENYISQNHSQLLNITIWARYLAWVILVVHFFWAFGIYSQQSNYLYYFNLGNQIQYQSFIDLLKEFPSYAFSIFIEIVAVVLRGFVYFLVLKGISLGLNMILETDINYRDQEEETNG
jgi:hypothetical protein